MAEQVTRISEEEVKHAIYKAWDANLPWIDANLIHDAIYNAWKDTLGKLDIARVVREAIRGESNDPG